MVKLLLKFLVFLSINLLVECEKSELLAVTVLFRHGCRSPRKTFKSDPYNDKFFDIWPEGLGHLTNLGKRQQFALGQWYRKYYKDFIPEKYDPNFLRVVSSDKDRCIMSAAANLAALFPPKEEQIWNSNLLWQPIPIHTTPEIKDYTVVGQAYCPKYKKLYSDLLSSKDFTDFMEERKDLFNYLTEHAGENVTTLGDVTFLHDTLFIENYINLTIPEWTKKVFPHKTLPLLTKVYVLDTSTTELARLKSGPLVDYITTFFEDVLQNPKDSQKFLMLSVHDSTISHLLNTLKVYDNTWPEYASTVMFELRRGEGEPFLNINFKNSTMMRNIVLNGCSKDCNFAEYQKIIQPIRITSEEAEKECKSVQ
ncbi:unnamed protein product [Diabrotica balteata]|uniref:acid phosphatase n=1 Tax=Diabrotica balteata TaxID=107213 RepID=A0A9N9XAV4_DIABA|nr:unnamed protein product [Diabrotica balteata]